ncbi:MAG TPA: MarR family transcriptional regulator [Propionibacteriaceae bacterium]|nr:MarR family transcriptional regulator [Propionibacteriaceae bacterium]
MPTKTRPPRATLELADALRPAVLRLARRIRQTRDESIELTASQSSVLAALAIRGRLSMGELAAEERVRPPTITRVVNALADRDLVRRTPAPHDGRQSLVELTDAGRALLLANQRLRAEWLAERLAELDAAELDVLRTAIPLMTRVAAG